MEQDNTTAPVSNTPTGTIISNPSSDPQTTNMPSDDAQTSTVPTPNALVVVPMSNQSSGILNPHASDNRWVRSILFFLLFFLILLFYSNLFVATILAALFNLLSVSIFDSISSAIFDYCERAIRFVFSPLIWLGKFLFVGHFTSVNLWLTQHVGPRIVRHSQSVTIIVTLIITVIMLASTILHPVFATAVGNVNDSVCLKTSLPWPSCASGVGVSPPLPDGVRIGLITDNTNGPFDQSAFNQDEKIVEKLIFGENQQACTGQHITLVLVTMLSRTVEDPQSSATLGVQHLQGNYLAQHHYNATHPALPLCFAIANVGTSDTADAHSPAVQKCSECYSMPQVLHRIAQFAHNDASVRGIVGFPFSQQVTEALQIIKNNEQSLASLPVISPSASSDNFSNLANFYRINSPNQNEAAVIAQYFCSHLVQSQSSPSIAILTDPANDFSGDLAIDFQNALTNLKCIDPAKMFSSIRYTNYDPTSIQKAVDQALKQNHASYIFFPGYDQDMDAVESQVYKDLPSSADTVTIIGGDGINNVNAATHYSYTRVYSANFAQPLPRTEPFVQDFINAGFANAYAKQTPTIDPSYFWMPTDTFLDIDAVQAMTTAVQALPDTHFTQNDFNTALQSISFPGETGNVTLQGNRVSSRHMSDRTQQYVYITCYDTKHILHLIDRYIANTDNASVQEDTSIPNITPCS